MKCTNCGKFEASIGDWCWRCDDDGTYALYEPDALEKEIEAALILSLKSAGHAARKMHSKRGIGRGTFDVRARIEGQIWHLEIKKEVGVVSKDQMRVLAALKERRANARILWGGEGCLDFLHEIEQSYEVNG